MRYAVLKSHLVGLTSTAQRASPMSETEVESAMPRVHRPKATARQAGGPSGPAESAWFGMA